MASVLILSLDTSSSAGSIAVLRDDQVLACVTESSDEPYSSRLFRQANALLKDLSLDLSQFDLFAACSGPGSFTGLRVGLTAAKAWAEVCGKPIAAVSALEAVALQVPTVGLRIPVLDARRGQVYFGGFRSLPPAKASTTTVALTRGTDDRVASPEDLLAFLRNLEIGGGLSIVTPLPQLLSPVAAEMRNLGIPVGQVSPFLAPFVGLLGLSAAHRGSLTDSLRLDANYVRRSDAELNWRPLR